MQYCFLFSFSSLKKIKDHELLKKYRKNGKTLKYRFFEHFQQETVIRSNDSVNCKNINLENWEAQCMAGGTELMLSKYFFAHSGHPTNN